MNLGGGDFRRQVIESGSFSTAATQTNLPVPVLADDASRFVTEESRSEARESTVTVNEFTSATEESRGGQNT